MALSPLHDILMVDFEYKVMTSSIAFFQSIFMRRIMKKADCIKTQVKKPVHSPEQRRR